MKHKKNIDRLFQERLKELEATPPIKSWDAIQKELALKTPKKRLPFWMKIASVAAVFVFLFTLGTIYFIPKEELNLTFLPDFINEQLITSKDTTSTKKIEQIQTESQPTLAQQTESIIEKDNTEIANENKMLETEVLPSPLEKANDKRFTLKDTKNLPFENTSEKDLNKPSTTPQQSRFTVATVIAPIYFNSFDRGSGIAEEFEGNSVSGKSSYSYGLKVAYKLSNKLSLQSGVNMINLGYSTNNVYVTPGVAVVDISSLTGSAPIAAKTAAIPLGKENANIADANDNSANLNQNFAYIEIPIEIKYNVVDGKLGVNLVGGFSTLLLNNDEVILKANNFTQNLGSSNTLRDVNFSGNFGLDVDYAVKKNLYLNISPMFKVQTNTFSTNSGSFLPYYLGVYTGINYKF